METRWTKQGVYLAPYDSQTEAWLSAKPDGVYVEADITAPRNARFHRKFFALLNVAYEFWEPVATETKWGIPEKNYDRFRADLTILAGYYKQSIRMDGTVITEPKSISFANMNEEEFQLYYSKCVDVILKHVLVGWTIEQIDQQVGSFL